MTTIDWHTTNDAHALFNLLRGQPRIHRSRWFAWMATEPSSFSFRKAILFVCGCLRAQGRVWRTRFNDDLIAFCEEWADTRDPSGEPATAALPGTRLGNPDDPRATELAARAFETFQPTLGAEGMMLRWLPEQASAPTEAALFRELFASPVDRVPLDPTWLTARARLVPTLARTIYDLRSFEGLPILADALEEVGCTVPALLDHLRAPIVHQRGCWAVDRLLGLS